MSESERNEAETGRRSDEDALLVAIFEHARASQTGLATVLGAGIAQGQAEQSQSQSLRQSA